MTSAAEKSDLQILVPKRSIFCVRLQPEMRGLRRSSSDCNIETLQCMGYVSVDTPVIYVLKFHRKVVENIYIQ